MSGGTLWRSGINFFFFKQKTAYEMRISDWSSDVCSSDLDAEIRTFQSGDRIANLRIAVTEKWKDKQSGERKERTEWVAIVLRAGLVDVAAKYLRQGSKIYVSGRLTTRKWKDSDGNDRYETEIIGDKMGSPDQKRVG